MASARAALRKLLDGVGEALRAAKDPCACAKCRDACDFFPGYFLPGEIPKAAKLKGVSIARFRREYLTNLDGHGTPTAWLRPKVIDGTADTEVAGRRSSGEDVGRCVFFDGKDCEIHDAKPLECRGSYPGHENSRFWHLRDLVIEAWALRRLRRIDKFASRHRLLVVRRVR